MQAHKTHLGGSTQNPPMRSARNLKVLCYVSYAVVSRQGSVSLYKCLFLSDMYVWECEQVALILLAPLPEDQPSHARMQVARSPKIYNSKNKISNSSVTNGTVVLMRITLRRLMRHCHSGIVHPQYTLVSGLFAWRVTLWWASLALVLGNICVSSAMSRDA